MALQILLGLPFITSHPLSYISRSFNLGRVFIHFWAVNFKFVPEQIFVSKAFAVSLLFAHLILLLAFAHYICCKHEGGILNFSRSILASTKLRFALVSSTPSRNCSNSYTALKILRGRTSVLTSLYKHPNIVTTMFVGIICARSLHCQFHLWHFYSLPYLLWRTSFPTLLRLIIFMGVEFCWNVYPSNGYSPALLAGRHLVILISLWAAPSEYPYVSQREPTTNKEE